MSELLTPEKKESQPATAELSTENLARVAQLDQVAVGITGQSPLFHADLAMHTTQSAKTGGIHFREIPLLGHLTLRGNAKNASFMQACATILGAELPTQPLTSVDAGEISTRWISPDEWLVTLPHDKAYEVEASLRNAVTGHISIVNVSGGQTLFEISGDHVWDLLKKSTPLDIHPSVFPIGKVAGTVFAKSSALVRRTGEARFELVVRRSFADYIWQWIQAASQEYGLVVTSS